jgi:hypothetical protein
MITDDSLDNFLQVRGFPFKGMGGCSEASTHPTFNPCYARYISPMLRLLVARTVIVGFDGYY